MAPQIENNQIEEGSAVLLKKRGSLCDVLQHTVFEEEIILFHCARNMVASFVVNVHFERSFLEHLSVIIECGVSLSVILI